jgi:hypothetical protein
MITSVCATVMTTMRRIHGEFVQILCNDQIVLIHQEVLTALTSSRSLRRAGVWAFGRRLPHPGSRFHHQSHPCPPCAELHMTVPSPCMKVFSLMKETGCPQGTRDCNFEDVETYLTAVPPVKQERPAMNKVQTRPADCLIPEAKNLHPRQEYWLKSNSNRLRFIN